MPFDANGKFSLVPGTIVSEGMTVQPSQHNPPFQDVAAGLSQVVLRSGVAPMTGPLDMNDFKISNVGTGDQPGDVVTRADIADLGVAIGDGAWSVRDLSPNWLRRDGKLCLRADYPELADLLPPLPDGLEVTQRHSGAGNIRKILQGKGKYIAVSGDGKVSISTDRKSWYTTSSGVSVLGNINLSGVGSNTTFGLDTFFSSTQSRNIAMSTDGESWFNQQVMPVGVNSTAVFFDGDYIYAFGISSDNSIFAILRTDNGVDWVDVTPSAKGLVRWVGYSGSTLLVVANAIVLTSINHGNSWSDSAPSPFPGGYDGLWTGTKFLSVGAGGVVRDSTNGSAWISRTSGTSNDLFAVARTTAGTVIGGSGGTLRLSTNEGLNFTGVLSGTSARITTIMADEDDPSAFLIGTDSGLIIEGIKTSPTQFRVPGDDPTYGWIRAK